MRSKVHLSSGSGEGGRRQGGKGFAADNERVERGRIHPTHHSSFSNREDDGKRQPPSIGSVQTPGQRWGRWVGSGRKIALYE